MNPATNTLFGLVVHLPRRVALLQDAVLEHRDPVAHGHGLDLVVRDVDRGGAQPALQRGDLGARLHPQLGVQVGQRLVHAEHLRLAHDRPAHGHPLALATGERLRLAVQELLEVEDLGRFPDPLGDHVLGLAGDLEREAHVLADAHVRVERVVLEDHRDVAVLGRHVRHVPAADQDRALVDLLEAGEHAQRGGLPATGRPDQDEELPVVDLEVQRVDRGSLRAGIDAACVIIGHSSHAVLLPTGRNVPDDPSSKGGHRLSCRSPSGIEPTGCRPRERETDAAAPPAAPASRAAGRRAGRRARRGRLRPRPRSRRNRRRRTRPAPRSSATATCPAPASRIVEADDRPRPTPDRRLRRVRPLHRDPDRAPRRARRSPTRCGPASRRRTSATCPTPRRSPTWSGRPERSSRCRRRSRRTSPSSTRRPTGPPAASTARSTRPRWTAA